MQTKIIITLLTIITLGIGYFVYQDFSEKRAVHKASIERENIRQERIRKIEEEQEQEKSTEERRKKEYGECYEFWSRPDWQIKNAKSMAEGKLTDRSFTAEEIRADQEDIALYNKCGDRPDSW